MKMLLRKMFFYFFVIVNYRCSGEWSDRIDNRENDISTGQLMKEFKISKDFEEASVDKLGTQASLKYLKSIN